MPHTKIGKWSVGLIGAFFVLLLGFYLFVSAGQRGGNAFFSESSLTILLLLAFACGVAGFVIGIVAIAKQKERAMLVYSSVVIGALVTLWIASETYFPH